MIDTEKLDKIISKINPGRKIDLEKLCPLLNQSCCLERCNAYQPNFDLNYVSAAEVEKYLEDGHDDWQEKLEKEGWKLSHVIKESVFAGLDEKAYLFKKQSTNNELPGGIKIGRCLWGLQ